MHPIGPVTRTNLKYGFDRFLHIRRRDRRNPRTMSRSEV
jgi:hypothetical protein